MQVSVENLGGLERRMTVQVPAAEIDQQVQNRLLSLSRKVRLDGFRPGKAPLKIIKRVYGPQIRQEILSEALERSLQNALTQENLKPVGGPKIEPKRLEEGADMEYSATFEVFPEFEPAGIEGLKVERPTAEVIEADIDTMIETLRKQRTTWNDVDRAAQHGDRITFDFESKRAAEDSAINKGENQSLVLGAGGMIKELEEKLIGLRAGDRSEFDISFPGDHPAAELAGKLVHFAVIIKAVAEPSLPEVNEEFAASFDIKEGGLDGLRKALRENMERELREAIKVDIKRQLMQQLLDANDIPLPQTMINQEIEHLAKQVNFPQDAADTEKATSLKTELFEAEAKRRVALGLIISRLVTTQKIKPDEARVQDHLASIASTYQEAEHVIQWYRQNPQALGGIRALALEDQVVDWLLERAAIIDKPSSFSEIMRPSKNLDTSSQEQIND